MKNDQNYDVIIVGGSYAGLSAALALGRALRKVLVIDSGSPCNRQTPHSHNFITQDGEQPQRIAAKAKAQVLKYDSVSFLNDLASSGRRTDRGFAITSGSDEIYTAKKLIFATGLKDRMPAMDGFSACWGISLIHCPYCHGYEVRHKKTGILANGDIAFHYAQLLRNWTADLALFTNGKSSLTQAQREKIEQHQIPIIEKEISHLQHENGQLEQVVFQDQSAFSLEAMYARPDAEQHCKIPEQLGCELTEKGLIKVNTSQKTSVDHIFACGDSASPLRAVAHAVATGNIAGAVSNGELTAEAF
ncbi:MAG: NAD(P)/FAD-dependent oxidoreductase [Bacteroidota bacterium]